MTMNKKIYFAGSIRGGRDDAALYKRMIDYMKRTNVVLTEHIGKSNMSLKAQTKPSTLIYTSGIRDGFESATW